jgi:L,D-transpeptidase catalytic domain/Putative peptidoglycan binding domain
VRPVKTARRPSRLPQARIPARIALLGVRGGRRILVTVAVTAALAATASGATYAAFSLAATTDSALREHAEHHATAGGHVAAPHPRVTPTSSTSPTAARTATDARSPSAPESTPAAPVALETKRPGHHARVRTTPRPGPPLLRRGDDGLQVRELQARLRQIAWFSGDVTDHYGEHTVAAVRGFQAKRQVAVTGAVDRTTLDLLQTMTHQPTADELANRRPDPADGAPLDARCRTGRALCIDKTSSSLRWVVDGHVRKSLDVRFGSSYTPTREGLFHVYWKDRDHVSHEYGSAMPLSMFFSRGQAVHYSSDFAARGYAGASHGCVNVRDYAGLAWLFDQVATGDRVVVYRS